MKRKYLCVLSLTLLLAGCGKEVEPVETPITPVPEVIESVEPEIKPQEDVQPKKTPTEEIRELKINNRTKIMVDPSNVDDFNKKEIVEEEVPEEVIEENALLTRFKQNQDNIKFPKNYKVSGDATTGSKSTSVTLQRMSSGETYASYNYGSVLLQQYIVDDNLNNKECYVACSADGKTIDGKASTYYAVAITTYSDFKVLGIGDAIKSGNNYKLDASFIVDGEQVAGELVVGDNMNVYGIKYSYEGIDYNLKVQTLLKMSKTKDDFEAITLSTENTATYSQYLYNAFALEGDEIGEEETETEQVDEDEQETNNASVPEGWTSVKESVDVELDADGNIKYIVTTKEYSYSDGSIVIAYVTKDLQGNIIATTIDTKEPSTSDSSSTSSSKAVLKPTFKLDENVDAMTLLSNIGEVILSLDASYNVTYKLANVNDPTVFAVDIEYTPKYEGEVKSFIEKFANDNYTTIIEWR